VTIRLKKRSVRFGVKVPENKLTAGSPIETLPLPGKVMLALQQNIGAPARALVKRGERVLTGQKIADSESLVSAPVHATVSGEVTSVTTTINPPTGQPMEALVITADGEDKWTDLEAADPEKLSSEEILKRIRAAGIVGLGGAQFPTHVKLSPPGDKKIDSVILDGCECEPYITSDSRVMLEYGEKVLSGLAIIKKVLSPQDAYIAIEDNKEAAIAHLEELIGKAGYDFKIAPLSSRYPMGAEKTLIKAILGREVPIGGLPIDVGAIIHNIATAKAIHDAVCEGRPLVERVVTVTGAVKNPKNLLVRFGTPIKELLDHCGGITEEGSQVIIGGPMMGLSLFDLTFPVCKGTNCVLVKAAQPVRERDCISCGRCIDACPVGLMPTLYPRYVKASRYEAAGDNYVASCTECGACAYICPANIPIIQYVKVAKNELRRRSAKK